MDTIFDTSKNWEYFDTFLSIKKIIKLINMINILKHSRNVFKKLENFEFLTHFNKVYKNVFTREKVLKLL